MEKKYQIFVSSTYTDLKDARNLILKSILDLHHIPAGMEMFSADDSDQWDTIKRIIDLSDYYILILGLRYGSISKNDNISFTEKEYDYAIENEIPVLSFVLNDSVPLSQVDRDDDLTNINKFRNKVLNNGKMSEFWSTKEELASKIIIALIKQFDIKPRIGWIKANQAISSDVMEEMATLSKLNRKLQEEVNLLSAQNKNPISYKIVFKARIVSFECLAVDLQQQLNEAETILNAEIEPQEISRISIIKKRYNNEAYCKAVKSYISKLKSVLVDMQNFIEQNKNKYCFGSFLIKNIGSKADEKIEIQINALNDCLFIEQPFIKDMPQAPKKPDKESFVINMVPPHLGSSNFALLTSPADLHNLHIPNAFRQYKDIQNDKISITLRELFAGRSTTVLSKQILIFSPEQPLFDFEIFSKNSTGRISDIVEVEILEEEIPFNILWEKIK